MKTVADVLEGAANHIEDAGWYKDNMFELTNKPIEDCRACTLGAIAISSGNITGGTGLTWWQNGRDEEGSRENCEKAVTFLSKYLSIDSVADWNDHQSDAQTVIDRLREAAAYARESGL